MVLAALLNTMEADQKQKKTVTLPEMVHKLKKRLERNPRRSGRKMT